MFLKAKGIKLNKRHLSEKQKRKTKKEKTTDYQQGYVYNRDVSGGGSDFLCYTN